METAPLRVFDKETDYKDLCKWAQGWGVASFPEAQLSSSGLIVPDVAAGFLYLTNSKLAFIDGYISNKESPKEFRHSALDQISSALLTWAKEARYTVVKCDTKVLAVKQRADRFGFKSMGTFEVFMKNLGGN